MAVPKRELTKREQYTASYRGFLLITLLFCGWAGYEYYRITDFEARGGFIQWWKGFDGLYSWGGKWAVVGFLLVIASIMFIVAMMSLRTLLHLPKDDSTPPQTKQN